ncbi:MAG TPA: hypothetical protein VII63_03465 [Caulobacteraceae bacterium]
MMTSKGITWPSARVWPALAAALSIAGHAWSTTTGGWVDAGLALQHRLGVKTAALTAERSRSEVDAFAKVLDPGPLAQLDSDLMTAVAAAAASSAEAKRSQALNAAGGLIALKDTQAAVAAARSDAIHVAFLRRRLGQEWGPGIARLSDAQRARLVKALSVGSAALVHVDTPSNAGQEGARTVKIDIGEDSHASGIVLGPARTSEPRLQSSGLIVEVTGPMAILLSIGLTQSAHIPTGSPQAGVILKRDALIRYRGATWAYVMHGARFERRLVEKGVPQEAGMFVPAGFSPGEQVVVEGAAGLFAAELAQASGAVR